ncbi:hypothetical protein M413DRAFT_245276 [Hebeloma cylindrosporum]|uniref:Uncharacterized protein n=1 Tax=Hebeloma cylindrosporum TaxID=76867 RepID=A0A0C2XKT2_HEBCY|nr:hypothetical protein M413DRAFT_245276 [Hebeloma cylindrosporum h7]
MWFYISAYRSPKRSPSTPLVRHLTLLPFLPNTRLDTSNPCQPGRYGVLLVVKEDETKPVVWSESTMSYSFLQIYTAQRQVSTLTSRRESWNGDELFKFR